GRIKRHQRHQQAGAGQLTVYSAGVIHPIPDVCPGYVLVSTAPDVRRRPPARRVAETVILLQHCEDTADRPILVSRSVWSAINEGLESGVFPAVERPPPGRNMDRNPVPGITLRETAGPILRTFALMSDRDKGPWDAGFRRDRRIASLGVRSREVLRDRGQGGRPRQPGICPAFRVRCL